MTQFLRDRRLVGRYSMKTPLRVRLWKSTNPEQIAESVNVSQQGIYFATNSVLHEGETVFHILGEDRLEPARMTASARPGPNGALVYPANE